MTPRARRIIGGLFAIATGSVLLIAACTRARAETVDGNRIVIIDGDTAALPCPGDEPCRQERIRILNIDAPETRGARCEAERALGYAAKAELARLLRGQRVRVDRCEPDTGRCEDRYRRTLARLSTKAGDVGAALIATGHALPWAAGPAAKTRRQQHWCGVQ